MTRLTTCADGAEAGAADEEMDYGLPAFPDSRHRAPSDYEREKQQAFEAELQAVGRREHEQLLNTAQAELGAAQDASHECA